MTDIIKTIFPRSIDVLSEIDGIFLYGSYAYGINTPKSDIDLIILTNGALNEIIQSLNQSEAVLDITFINSEQVNIVSLPTPINGYYKMGKYINKSSGYDIALGIKDVIENGLTIYGERKDILKKPSKEIIDEYLCYIFPFIESHFKDPILNYCRIAYTKMTRKVTNKIDAGKWFIKNFDVNSDMIAKSIEAYQTGEEHIKNDQDIDEIKKIINDKIMI